MSPAADSHERYVHEVRQDGVCTRRVRHDTLSERMRAAGTGRHAAARKEREKKDAKTTTREGSEAGGGRAAVDRGGAARRGGPVKPRP